MFPYTNYYSPLDSDYFRAIAEERVAREQYAAARRAQEEAHQRAARARAARCAYAAPYSSYIPDDDYNDLDLEDCDVYQPQYGGQSPFSAYGLDPYQYRALMKEQRRRELLEEQRRRELLEIEREKQRRRLEEERMRLEEERKRFEEERQREEELARQRLLEETLRQRRTFERDRSSQQATIEPLLRALGIIPDSVESAAETEQETLSRQPRSRRAEPSRSPVRQFPFGRSSTINTPTSATSIPISTEKSSTSSIPSPKSTTPKPSDPTPEQIAAAEKVQEAYRAYTSRKQALKSLSSIRKRFLAARSAFVFPSTLDFDISTDGRSPTTVTVAPDTALPNELEALEGVPRLAYTPTNVTLRAYEEELNRILGALDEIQSRGDMGVRAARRELARAVEREAERVERWCGVVWNSRIQPQQESQSASVSEPVAAPALQEMQVEPEVHTEDAVAEDSAVPVEDMPMQSTEDVSTAQDVPMEAEPVPDSTSQEAPMEVEEQNSTAIPAVVADSQSQQALSEPESALPAPAPHKPTYAEVVVHQLTPVPDIVVESPSRTDLSAPNAVASDAHVDDDHLSRPCSPALTHSPSEEDLDMEIEPHEIDTPPLTASAEEPLAIEVEDGVDAHEPLLKGLPPQEQKIEMRKSRPMSLVDTDWHEVSEFDMF